MRLYFSLFAPPGSSSLRAYPLLSVITRQPPNLPPHLPQPSSPGAIPSQLPLLSPQHPRASEPSPSQTPLSISSESDTERSTPRLKKPRRSRTIFTELQLMGLEKKFQKQKYLSTPDRSVKAHSWSLNKHMNETKSTTSPCSKVSATLNQPNLPATRVMCHSAVIFWQPA